MIRLIAGFNMRGQVAGRAAESEVAAEVLAPREGLLKRMVANFRRAPAFELFDPSRARAAIDAYVDEQRERLAACEVVDPLAERRLETLAYDAERRLPHA